MATDKAELALQAAQQLHARLQLLVERTLVEAEADSFAGNPEAIKSAPEALYEPT